MEIYTRANELVYNMNILFDKPKMTNKSSLFDFRFVDIQIHTW